MKAEAKEKCSVVINGVEYIRKQNMEITENYVIVRTYSAGVFAGNLESRDSKEVVLRNARRIWYWAGAASLSQLAMEGTKNPDDCKFPCPVNLIELTEIIEVLPCTKKAEDSIKGVKIWQE